MVWGERRREFVEFHSAADHHTQTAWPRLACMIMELYVHLFCSNPFGHWYVPHFTNDRSELQFAHFICRPSRRIREIRLFIKKHTLNTETLMRWAVSIMNVEWKCMKLLRKNNNHNIKTKASVHVSEHPKFSFFVSYSNSFSFKTMLQMSERSVQFLLDRIFFFKCT